MYKELLQWLNGGTDAYGTSPGLTYVPEVPAYQPSDFPSLNMGDTPQAAELFRNRAAMDFTVPSSLGRGGEVGPDFSGQGLQFNSRPDDGMYASPADIQAQTIKNLARGGSNVPSQLGSDVTDKAKAGIRYEDLAKLGLLGAAKYASGNSQPQQTTVRAPMTTGDGWGSPYQKRSFLGLGGLAKASPYAVAPDPHRSKTYKELLAERIAQMRTVKGLLD